MKLLFISQVFLIFISLQGCLMSYQQTQYNSSNKIGAEQKQKEKKAKEAIKLHVQKNFKNQGTYKGHQFGDLYVIRGKEIRELDSLIDRKNKVPTNATYSELEVETLTAKEQVKIDAKKVEIKEKKVYPWYEMSHIFSVKSNESTYTIYEYTFELYPNYTVKDVSQEMTVVLNKVENENFQHFMDQKPLFVDKNYSYNYGYIRDMNNRFYDKLYTALENEQYYKDDLLKSILFIVNYIINNNEFDEEKVTRAMADKWINQQSQSDFTIPKDTQYDSLVPLMTNIDDKDVLSGYLLASKYLPSESENQVSKKLLFYFDLNFVLLKVIEDE